MPGGRGVPRSDEVIRRFFASERRGVTGRRLERLGAAEEDLRARLAEPLAYEIARLPGLRGEEVGPAVWTVEASVEHAVWMLRQEREATRRH